MSATISFTFDDGRANHVTPGAKILEEFGFKGTFYVCPGLTEDRRVEWKRPAQMIELASWGEIADAAKQGHEIGNHSWDHPSFPYASKGETMTEKWMNEQVVESAEIIQCKTETELFSWAWPYHWSVTHMTTLIKEHHVGIRPFVNRGTYNRDVTDSECLLMLKRYVDKLVKRQMWGCAIIHDLDTGHNPLPGDVFRKHLEYVASKDIEVKTVSEVLRET